MFDFFIKKKEVVLDCFTYNQSAYENAKIDQAHKYFPEWWRQTPGINENTNKATIKNCIAFIDFYRKGIVIPCWFELALKIHQINNPKDIWYEWAASNEDFSIRSTHTQSEFEKFCNHDGKNFKIQSVWFFKEKDDIKFVWSQPTWNMRELLFNISVLPGVISFKNQHATNINFLISNRTEENFITIEPLMPLAILHPMTERNVKIVNHLLSEEEWNKKALALDNMILKNSPIASAKSYGKKISLTDKIDNINKCPFHFKL